MIIDNQSIENLELIESKINGLPSSKGSLLEWIDHTVT